MNSPQALPKASSITIKRAGPKAAQDVFALFEKYYAELDVLVRDAPEELRRYLAGGRDAIWLAYTRSQPSGCILYRCLSDAKGELKRLYVRKRYRREGIATLLLEAAENHARGVGARELYLDSMEHLRPALAFYEGRGYGYCERYNSNPQATIFMHKLLA